MSEENKANADVKLAKELKLKEDFTPPTMEEWREKVEKDLKGKPFDKIKTKTYENITLEPIYTKKDIKNLPHLKETPGYNSYVRGTKAEGYVGKSWDIAQEIPYPLAEDFNEALKYDLEKGQTAINLPLDKATRLGLDADYAQTEEVGEGGVSISGLRSLQRALNNVDLENYPLYVEAGFSSLPFLSVLNALMKKENKDVSKIKGAITADPIGYLATEGQLPTTMEFAFDKMKVATEWINENKAAVRTIGVSGLPYHNSGASATQELAFMIATASEYLNQMIERGIDVNTAASSIRFTFGIGTFFFMEISKLRAAKILWSKVVEAFGGDEEAQKMNIHAKTSKYQQTLYDPYVNMLRTTTEAFSAIVGGVDSLHTNPFNEVFGEPDKFSRRIARNVQIMLKEESHLDQLIDPAGGSFFVEKLTHEVAEAAWKLFQEIDDKGGIIETLKNNFVQEEIAKVVEMRNKDLSKRKERIVGSNMYANVAEEKLEAQKVDHKAVQEKRADYLQKFRVSQTQEKDNSLLQKLGELVNEASSKAIDKAAEAILDGATLGEVAKSIVATAGDSVEVAPIKMHRAAELFEELRFASEKYKQENGIAPKVFLANMGPLRQHKARADFSRGFFEVGGFDVIYPDGFDTPEKAAEAVIQAGVKAVCICSTDDNYPEVVPSFAKKVKEADKDISIILAGYPKDQIEAHKEAGVDEFIFLGANVHQLLSNLLTKMGAM